MIIYVRSSIALLLSKVRVKIKKKFKNNPNIPFPEDLKIEKNILPS